MKKVIIPLLLLLLLLTGCGSKNIANDLKSTKWNVVSTNGETYTAEFNQDTVSFQMGILSLGMFYEIDKNVITLTKEEKTYSYEVENDKNEYKFTAANDDTKDVFGDLTLSPVK